MISLCNDKIVLLNSLDCFKDSAFIRENIRLYLLSYGTKYDFCQFFLQYCDEDNSVTSVVMRYNSQVYALLGDKCIDESVSFISGFTDCEIIVDNSLFNEYFKAETCYVMQKRGIKSKNDCDKIKLAESASSVAKLVTKDYEKEKADDFFLNTAHQMRHGFLSVAGFYEDDKLVSVVSFSDSSMEFSLVPFVFTDNYFRGKGIASKLLSFVCQDSEKNYVLLCQKHNVEFYKKCGFEQKELCYRFIL